MQPRLIIDSRVNHLKNVNQALKARYGDIVSWRVIKIGNRLDIKPSSYSTISYFFHRNVCILSAIETT